MGKMLLLSALLLLGQRSCDAFTLRSFSSSQQQQPTSCLATSSYHFRLHATLEKSGSSASSSPSKEEEQEGAAKTTRLPGTAELGLPWEELGFEFRPTRSHLKMVHRDGEWQAPELVEGEPYLKVHIGATALHYGQSCFEGLKAFCHADNSVFLFSPEENAARMQSSCRRTLMAELPTDKFVKACQMVVRDNIEFVPPYGSNGALYIRPLLFGSGPRIGLQPADEYTFLCMVIPVGDYYKGGLSNPVKGRIITDYDRAAPRGVVRHGVACDGGRVVCSMCLRLADCFRLWDSTSWTRRSLVTAYTCVNAGVPTRD
jgi:hypothetical protein